MSVKSYWFINYYKQIYQNLPSYGGWKAVGGDTFKIALYPPSFRPNQDVHNSYNDIIQVSGQGYTAGGQTLVNKTISTSTGALVLGASPVTWAGCVFTVRGAAIYDDTNASPLNKQLVRWMDFEQDVQLAGGTLKVTFDGNGSFTVIPPADTTPPLFTDGIVDSSLLTITFSENLDTTSVPDASSFFVLVDGVQDVVSSVAVTANKASLTLTDAVVADQVVTVSYTQPGSSQLRDLAFNPVASFAAISVLNVTVPEPPPDPDPDVNPPTVTITSPANGAIVSDTITVAVTATDVENPITSVVLFIDGTSFSTDTVSPYSFSVDTTSLTNANHDLVAKAQDAAGNIGTSATVTVTVNNVVVPPPDTTPPSVSITFPQTNAFLAGTITVAVTATDNVGVTSTTLFVDGISQGVDASQPYAFTLNTTMFTQGVHQLTSTAIDAAGNTGTSSSVAVTFDNAIPVLSSALINGATLTLNYNETLGTFSIPATSSFVVQTDGNNRVINSVSISGIQVLITLAVPVLAANVVTISYTAGVNPIKDRAGNNAANLTNQAVTNQTPGDTTAPQLVSLTVNTSTLTVQYNENLDTTSVPATSAYTIGVNGTVRSVSSLTISGANVVLTLSSPVISSDTVTASYVQPATGKVRDIGQNNVAAFTNLPVTNTTAAPPTDIASFVSQNIPLLTMPANSTQNVSVTMRNDGTATWNSQGNYVLYSQNPSGNTRWGLSQVATPGNVLPNGNAVYAFTITAPTSGNATISWNSNTEPDLAGYRVYYGTTSGVYTTMIDVGNVTSYVVTGLTAGVTYYFAVSAYDTSNNESVKSTQVSLSSLTFPFQWRMRHNTTEFGQQSTSVNISVTGVTPSGIFVSTTGSDSTGNGSQLNPYRTLAKAFQSVQPSGQVLMRGGIYAEAVNNNIPAGTSWTNTVKLAAFNSATEPVTLRPATGSQFVVWLQDPAKQYIEFENLIIDGVNVASNTIKLDRSATTTTAAHHIRFRGCEVIRSPFQACLILYGGDFNEFIGCSFHNNGKLIDSDGHYSYAFYVKGSNNTIDKCDIYDQGGSGIQIYSTTASTEPPNSNTVKNCRIHDNAVLAGPNQGRGAGINIASGALNIAYNNLVYNNYIGILVSLIFNAKVYNNSIGNNPNIGLWIDGGGGSSLIYRNNISFGNATNLTDTSSAVTKTPNLIGTNPLWVNATAGDFHLNAGSPAINTGATLTEFNTDYDGNTRPSGAWDQGAYER